MVQQVVNVEDFKLNILVDVLDIDKHEVILPNDKRGWKYSLRTTFENYVILDNKKVILTDNDLESVVVNTYRNVAYIKIKGYDSELKLDLQKIKLEVKQYPKDVCKYKFEYNNFYLYSIFDIAFDDCKGVNYISLHRSITQKCRGIIDYNLLTLLNELGNKRNGSYYSYKCEFNTDNYINCKKYLCIYEGIDMDFIKVLGNNLGEVLYNDEGIYFKKSKPNLDYFINCITEMYELFYSGEYRVVNIDYNIIEKSRKPFQIVFTIDLGDGKTKTIEINVGSDIIYELQTIISKLYFEYNDILDTLKNTKKSSLSFKA